MKKILSACICIIMAVSMVACGSSSSSSDSKSTSSKSSASSSADSKSDGGNSGDSSGQDLSKYKFNKGELVFVQIISPLSLCTGFRRFDPADSHLHRKREVQDSVMQ